MGRYTLRREALGTRELREEAIGARVLRGVGERSRYTLRREALGTRELRRETRGARDLRREDRVPSGGWGKISRNCLRRGRLATRTRGRRRGSSS